MITWAIAIAASVLVVIIILFLVYRLYQLCNYQYRKIKIQKPELIDQKHFVTSDQLNLPLLGKVQNNHSKIVVGIYDFLGDPLTFNHLLKNTHTDISFISYAEPALMNKKILNIGGKIQRCIEVLNILYEKWPNKKIYLLLEGYSCGLASKIIPQVAFLQGVIYCNPVTHAQPFRFHLLTKIFAPIAFIIKGDAYLPMQIPFDELTVDAKMASHCKEHNGHLSWKLLFQYDRLQQTLFKTIWATKELPTTWIQAENDLFCSKINLDYWRSHLPPQVAFIDLPNQHHFNLNFDLSTVIKD